MKKSLGMLALVVGASLLMMSLLGGCSTATPAATQAPATPTATQAPATTAAATPAPAATPTPAPTPAPTQTAPALSGTVSFYTISEWTTDPNLIPAYKAFTDKFAQQYPGCTAQILSDPWSTWENKLMVEFSAGNAPDVVLMDAQYPTLANAGNLIDLGTLYDDKFFSDYPQGVVNKFTWQGKHFAVPYTLDTRVLYYNKDLFTKAGLDPNTPPNTWDDLLNDAKKCTMDTNGDGKNDVYGYGLSSGEFPLFCGSDQASFEKTNSDGTLAPNVDTPEFKAFLQLLQNLKSYAEPDFATMDLGKLGTLYSQQKVAMIIDGSFIFDQNKNMSPNDSWVGVAMIPRMTADGPYGSNGGGFAIGINKLTKNPQLAAKMLQLLYDPTLNTKMMTNAAASLSCLNASEWAKNPFHAVELKSLPVTRDPVVFDLHYSKIMTAVTDMEMQMLLGKTSVNDAVPALQKNMEDILASK